MRTPILFAALSAGAAIFSPAAAQQTSHAGADKVLITDFIGTVHVKTVASGAVRLNRTAGDDASYPLEVREDGSVLIVHSDEDPDENRWHDRVNWRRNHEDAFRIFLEDYPTLSLTIPAGTSLEFESAVIMLDADNTMSALKISGGHVDGYLGDLASADIGIHGSGDLKVGDVAGALAISIHGSGDFIGGSAASLAANIHGSGDIKVVNIGAASSADIHGSGDIEIGDINGPFEASIHGSGDIDAGNVKGGADLSIQGSGDISLASVAGESRASIHGSGDMDIATGRADRLFVDLSGSGGFDFGGVAINPDIRANNSASVFIRSHEGTVRARGRGDIRVSGVDYSDDD
ncbi:GIN domain-containing protein [Hyphococcus sp.]|uniref:GIN domain-containing protein n=1 Tax=Hyphococcus sp. TaxID=2038636 RepID=UPI002084E817|nr:MAG: hypothetical protein DHS20C04_23340 [Marinicaulis sp.]